MTNPAHIASNPRLSAWVSANAGSGKTHVLVTRLVRLMLDGALPEQLLCLTYTRAAAAEMQERLADLLADWARMDDDALTDAIAERAGVRCDASALRDARQLFARALETPGGLRVQTIHGFCQSLLYQFPLEAGVSPQFRLLDEAQSQLLMRDALRRVQGASFARLSRRLVQPDLEQLAKDIVHHRAHFEPEQTQEITDAIWGQTRPRFDTPQDAVTAGLREMLGGREETLDALLVLAADALSPTQNARVQNLHTARTVDDSEQAWEAMKKFFFTTAHIPRANLLTKAFNTDHPHIAETLQEMAESFTRYEQARRAALLVACNHDLVDFAREFLRHYDACKAHQDGLDYDDLIRHMRDLLTKAHEAAWVLYKLDGGLEHVLVDEAQDTSPPQWQVIGALIEEFFAGVGARDDATPRTFFAVGDPKQSIFSFQGADLSRFYDMRGELTARAAASGLVFETVPLTKSYRSAPQILASVDAVFAQGEAQQGLVEGASESVSHEAARDTAQGYVELWDVVRTEPMDEADAPGASPHAQYAPSGAQQLAVRIAQKIKTLTAKQAGYSAGDILILVRRRGVFFDAMLRALKRADILVAGADRMVLADELAVQDLLNAAAFALSPRYDLALAIFLRGPFGGVSEDALMALAIEREGSLWDAFRTASDAPNAPPHFVKARQRLDWLLAHADRLSPFDYFSRFLRAEGGYRALVARMGREVDDAVNAFLQTILSYEREEVVSLQGFLHWARHTSHEIKRDMEQGQDAVRIMTVHGAKGLEAPIVFLPDTCMPASGTARGNLFDMTDTHMPIWRARKSDVSDYGARLQDAVALRDVKESNRLLYVAMTRARDRLYIGGYLGANRKTPPENCWYELIYNGLHASGAEGVVRDPADGVVCCVGAENPKQAMRVEAPSARFAELPEWLGAPYLSAPRHDHIISPSRLRETDRAVWARAGDGDGARKRGDAAHHLLEVLPRLSEARRGSYADAYLASVLADLSATERARLIENVFAVLALPELAELFAPTARAEVPIGGALKLADGKLTRLSGVIDRLYVSDKRACFVDFKTGQMPAKADTPIAYRDQLAAYAGLLAAAYPARDIIGGLVWVDAQRVQWFEKEELQIHLDSIRIAP